jgi:hypothetical protein
VQTMPTVRNRLHYVVSFFVVAAVWLRRMEPENSAHYLRLVEAYERALSKSFSAALDAGRAAAGSAPASEAAVKRVLAALRRDAVANFPALCAEAGVTGALAELDAALVVAAAGRPDVAGGYAHLVSCTFSRGLISCSHQLCQGGVEATAHRRSQVREGWTVYAWHMPLLPTQRTDVGAGAGCGRAGGRDGKGGGGCGR